MQIQMLSPLVLKPYAGNPRKNKDAVDALAESLREFGFKQHLVVDKNYEIVVGHTRWLAAKKLGLKEVPVLVASDLTPEQIKAYRIADNRTRDNSTWDDELLKLELADLEAIGYDLNLTGFDNKQLDKLLARAIQSPAANEEYSAQYQVVATCKDETDQQSIYQLLTSMGYQCKVLSM